MRYGNIDCDCGQAFYFETYHRTISCIKCGKVHDLIAFNVKLEEEEVIDEVLKDSVEEANYTPKEGEESGAHI